MKKTFSRKSSAGELKPIGEWTMTILWTTDYVRKCHKVAEINPLLNYKEWTIINAKQNEKE